MPRSAEELAADFRSEAERLDALADDLIKISLLLEGRHYTQADVAEYTLSANITSLSLEDLKTIKEGPKEGK